MQTSWFTETFRADLEAVGAMGSEKAMKVADRMITVAVPLAKARMLEALSMALTELSGVLGIERIDLRVSGDDVTFVEKVNIQGNEIAITYTGKVVGDEIKFTRKVGDFATEEFVAKRVKD